MTGVISGGGQWAFVAAAYGLTLVLTGAVLWTSWRAMKKAEKSDTAITPRKGKTPISSMLLLPKPLSRLYQSWGWLFIMHRN